MVYYASLSGVAVPILMQRRILPLPAKFPIQPTSTPFFEITYFWEFMTITWFCGSMIAAFDCLTYSMFFEIGVQFDLLKETIEIIGDPVRRTFLRNHLKLSYADDSAMNIAALEHCFLQHEVLMKFIDEVQKIYNVLILSNFGYSFLAIGVTMYKFISVE